MLVCLTCLGRLGKAGGRKDREEEDTCMYKDGARPAKRKETEEEMNQSLACQEKLEEKYQIHQEESEYGRSKRRKRASDRSRR